MSANTNFRITSFEIRIRGNQNGSLQWKSSVQATVKAEVNDETRHAVADGNSPLDALRGAVCKVIAEHDAFYPIDNLWLTRHAISQADVSFRNFIDGPCFCGHPVETD